MKSIRKLYGWLAITVVLSCLLLSFCNVKIQAALPSTFGYTSTSTAYVTGGANLLIGSLYTSGSDAEGAFLQSMTWYGKAYSTTVNVKAVLVDGTSLEVLAVSDPVSVNTSDAWRTCSFTGYNYLEASKTYYLCLISDGSCIYYCNTDSGTAFWEANSYTTPVDVTASDYNTRNFCIYASYDGFDVTLTSNPAIAASITVNGSAYSTPATLVLGANNYTFVSEASLVYSDVGYVFNNWIMNGSAYSTDASITLNVTDATTLQANYTAYSAGLFHFYGPYNETSGLLIDENVTVVAHYLGAPNYEFAFNTSWVYPPDYSVQYFEFVYSDNTTRYYWIDPSELISSIYIFKADDPSSYLINFLDYTGILQTYPYVTAQTYINGTLFTVEKCKADEQNNIILSLIPGSKYELTIGNEDTNYIYGDFLATGSTSVQLILRAVELPKETILIYKYLTFYAYRNFTSNTITFFYNDTKLDTTSLSLVIYDSDGLEAYSDTYTADTVTLAWTGGTNTTSYNIQVTVEHGDYGTVEWSQYLASQFGGSVAMFDFSFLGDWSFDMTYLFPTILILFAACCFSALNAEVGAIIVSIIAILLTIIGWIPIPVGSLVAAFALSILMALVYNKRRVQAY